MTESKALKSLNIIIAKKIIQKRLPFETITELRRLQDILLELCARNIMEIFIEGNDKLEKTLKKGVKLGLNLFERIIETRKEMHLFMSLRCANTLFRFRSELNWQNIDYCPPIASGLKITYKDITLTRSGVPTRKASDVIHLTDEKTETNLSRFYTFSSKIEHLEINIDYKPFYEPMANTIFPKIQMQNLRSLIVSFFRVSPYILPNVDISSFSETIEVLELREYLSDIVLPSNKLILMNLLNNCKNLLSLSLQVIKLNDNDADLIFKAISSLKNLRSLHLNHVKKCNQNGGASFDLSRIISHLPNLKYLDVSFSDFTCSDPNFAKMFPKLTLDYLRAIRILDKTILKIPTKCLVKESYEKLASLIWFLESTISIAVDWSSNIEQLNALFSSAVAERHSNNVFNKLERALLRFIMWNQQNHLNIAIRTIKSLKSNDLSSDFWGKLIRFVISNKTYNLDGF